jgi:YD repeat-containing protein
MLAVYPTNAYDGAGNQQMDGVNQYLYDAEGRVCAYQASNGTLTQYTYDAASNSQYLYDGQGHVCAAYGPGGWTGYLYNAGGQRVAKVPILSGTPTSCDPNTNGVTANFANATLYVVHRQNAIGVGNRLDF